MKKKTKAKPDARSSGMTHRDIQRMSSDAYVWCVVRDIPPLPFNIVTALNDLGVIKKPAG
jgi:hypothetical protein